MPELSEFLPHDMDGRDALLSKFGGEDGVARMAKSYQELEGYRGRSVALPSDGADDDQWRSIMSKFGAPSSPGEYRLPEGMDEEMATPFRGQAHDAMLTQKQFEKLAKNAQDRTALAVDGMADERKASIESIKEQFGAKYDAALAHARRAAQANGISDGWESNPEMFSLLAKTGSQMSGDTAPDGDARSPTTSATKIASRLRELMSSEAYSDSFHGEHEAAMMAYDALRGELREAGYDSVFHDDLLSVHSPLRGFSEQARPWQNPNTTVGGS